MKKLIFLLIPILFACVKENNHAPLKETICGGKNNGYWSIHAYTDMDTVYYDTLRTTQNSSYLIFNRDGSGSIKFYSKDIFDQDFDYWTVENDMIYILSGDMEGYWYVDEDMDYINRADDHPRRRAFTFFK
jgi:hypothetical protein